MKRNGKLAKREERTVLRAIGIIDEWVRAHLHDERQPYAWDSIASCVHQLRADARIMFDED